MVSQYPNQVGEDDILAEGWLLCRIIGERCSWDRVHDPDRQAVHLAGPGRRAMGEIPAGRLRPLALCLFRLIPAIGGLVDVWDRGGVYFWRVEGVSY